MNKKRTTAQKSATEPAGKKVCSRCKRLKAYPSFNKDKGVSDGYSRICRVCRLRIQRKSRKEYLRKVDKLKAKVSCAKCGEARAYLIDFHHNDPSKKLASVSHLRDTRASIRIIKKEIAKCTALCSNHHRELHHKKLTIEQYLKETEC